MKLRGTRILVADDQRDVAVTLTSGLRDNGAVLTYVPDGEAALSRITAGGIDLVLLDMKMPPKDWGGLWLLAQLRDGGVTVPVIVLSGEGGQRQTIEAMRLGARDWVDKDAVGRELVARAVDVMQKARDEALQGAAQRLPSPVAHDFSHYLTAPSLERAVTEGLRTLEGTLKFGALLALSDRPEGARGLPGVQPAQFARPSLGTWLAAARALQAESAADSPAATWLTALLPERNSIASVQDFVTMRNDIAHGGHEATQAQADALRDCLINWAHRLSVAWQWRLHVVTSLTYDGTAFDVRTRLHAGASLAYDSSFISQSPLPTGEIVLVEPTGRALSLAPWLEIVEVGDHDAVGVYDSTSLPRRERDDDPPLQYLEPESRKRGLRCSRPGAAWSSIRHHLDRS